MLIHGALPQDTEAIAQVLGQVLFEVMQLQEAQEPIEAAPRHVKLWVWIKTGHTEPVEAQEQYLDTVAPLEVASTLEAQLPEVVHTVVDLQERKAMQERKHREVLRIEVLEVELGIPVPIEVLAVLPEALRQEVAATAPEAAAPALEVVVAIEARAAAPEVVAAIEVLVVALEVRAVLQGHPPQAEDLQVQEEVVVEDNKS